MSLGLTVLKEVELDLFLRDFPEFWAEEVQKHVYKISTDEGSLIVYLKNGKINCFEARVVQKDFSIFEKYINKYKSNFIDDEGLILISQGEDINIGKIMSKYGVEFFNN